MKFLTIWHGNSFFRGFHCSKFQFFTIFQKFRVPGVPKFFLKNSKRKNNITNGFPAMKNPWKTVSVSNSQKFHFFTIFQLSKKQGVPPKNFSKIQNCKNNIGNGLPAIKNPQGNCFRVKSSKNQFFQFFLWKIRPPRYPSKNFFKNPKNSLHPFQPCSFRCA